jgi:hypothetical protein
MTSLQVLLRTSGAYCALAANTQDTNASLLGFGEARGRRGVETPMMREQIDALSNGEQVSRVAGLAMVSKRWVDFTGYWQRHVRAE